MADPLNIVTAYLLIFFSSWAFDFWIISGLENDKQIYPFFSLLWLGGNIYTLGVVSILIITPEVSLVLAGAFVSLLAPIVGFGVWRFVQARREDVKMFQEITDHLRNGRRDNLDE